MRLLATKTSITKSSYLDSFDSTALSYIAAVEAADGQYLEDGVKIAINNFIAGCKADGIWQAIKACCILAGARTLNGALVPLIGSSPTNFNFVSADYNRKTGLVGDGSTKYIDSNRNNNVDPQDNNHNALWISNVGTVGSAARAYLAAGGSNTGTNNFLLTTANQIVARNRFSTAQTVGNPFTGFLGSSRNTSASFVVRSNGSNTTFTATSQTPFAGNVGIFRQPSGTTATIHNARIAFYSIGEAINLNQFDARITALINSFAAIIP